MQMIFVNRAKYAILPLLQPTKKRSAYRDFVHRATIASPLLRVDLQRQHSRRMSLLQCGN
jgi:hypothetical protein